MRLFTALTMSALVLLAAPAMARETWTRFSYPEAGFSAELPEEPRLTLGPDEGVAMKDRRTFAVEKPGCVLMAVSAMSPVIGPDALKRAAEGAAGRAERTMISHKAITVRGETGYETVVRSKSGNLMLQQLVYSNGRLLQFMVGVGPGGDVEACGRRFLDSVILLPR